MGANINDVLNVEFYLDETANLVLIKGEYRGKELSGIEEGKIVFGRGKDRIEVEIPIRRR